jgi:hypothetical protein
VSERTWPSHGHQSCTLRTLQEICGRGQIHVKGVNRMYLNKLMWIIALLFSLPIYAFDV